MSFESLTNRGEYLPAHYLAEVFPSTLKQKDGLLARWRDATEAADDAVRASTGNLKAKAERATPRAGLAALRRDYLKAKEHFKSLTDDTDRHDLLCDLHQKILAALGFAPRPGEHTVTTATGAHQVGVAHADERVVALDCGWADDADAASDPEGAGRLLAPVTLDNRERIITGAGLTTHLFTSEKPPSYVLLLGGGVITLADRRSWGEGRYLAVNLDLAFARNDTKAAGELDTIAALFGADSLYPPPEGGDDNLTKFLNEGRQHAVGVSSELREGLSESVELIANEVLNRLHEAGVSPEQIDEPKALGRTLTREALRYLYRILFLLYAEARPELGVLPVDHPEYAEGYSLARLGELASRPMLGERAKKGFHLYDSLNLLFRMVNGGHRARDGEAVDEKDSESEGIRFEPLRSDLFLPEALTLIGRERLVHPDDDEDDPDARWIERDRVVHPDGDPDDPDARRIDTRLRNETLREVLRLLMLTKGKRKERGGFISYAQLGINQLGAVYEGLMSYTGFIATEELYEVAKSGDPDKGSWMIPASQADGYADEVFVRHKDDNGKRTGERHRCPKGSFVYRLAGRDRQTSASYYTPQSLTSVTVELALKYRLDQDGATTPARELLDWTICEPALGSGAFLNEAIDQVATEYLRRRQHELGENLDPDRYLFEKQKVKAYIALHNCYGVDLNRTAVELAEVSLWLNVMHPGLQAPWFGLHLRRGNSLIGANRRYYLPEHLKKKVWLGTTPIDCPLNGGEFPDGAVHHFLLPGSGWGAVAGESEAKKLAPEAAKALSKWRNAIKTSPKGDSARGQTKRLRELAKRVEFLWDLVQQRLEISEREIRRSIDIWEAEDLPPVTEAVSREKILADLEAKGTPYWRLKTLMDTWCALWFWPLDKVGLLDGTAADYGDTTTIEVVENEPENEESEPETDSLFGFAELGMAEQLSLSSAAKTKSRSPGRRKATAIERLARKVPLSTLDSWLDFAEALLGRTDVTDESSLFQVTFDNLDSLETFEDELPGKMAMDEPHKLAERFPWLDTAVDIADEQGFFHWELASAQVFARGGFDLQIGNPPWVRPDWDEGTVLAAGKPWFKLAEKPSPEEWSEQKAVQLQDPKQKYNFIAELVSNVGTVSFLTSLGNYPLLAGVRSELSKVFMCRCWSNLARSGIAGLIHPDTHFTGASDSRLRVAAYKHLRLHGHFQNRRLIFSEVDWNKQFGVHIYGGVREIDFEHACWLFDPETLIASSRHDGSGPPPGIKHHGYWDLRSHRSRMIRVREQTLMEWRNLVGTESSPVIETKLLYPVTNFEQEAISALARWSNRLENLGPSISRGYYESPAKQEGVIREEIGYPENWKEVILRGPQFGVATPIAKLPPATRHTDKVVDLNEIDDDLVPSTEFVRSCPWDRFVSMQDMWPVSVKGSPQDSSSFEGSSECPERKRYTEFYRVAWREMIPASTERSLFPAVFPPGPTHIHAVRSMALPSMLQTVLVAGFWSAIPLDYLIRITGRGHLDVADVMKMPVPESNHPLAPDLLLRALRLNCLTQDYSDLWEELSGIASLGVNTWACDWPGLEELGDVGRKWRRDTALRTEHARRAALVEIDALVSVWIGIDADALVALYRSRFPQLVSYEEKMWFDSRGRKIAANYNQWGHGQEKRHFGELESYLKDPENAPPPEGYLPPFYKADREAEMRRAHEVFSAHLAAKEDSAS